MPGSSNIFLNGGRRRSNCNAIKHGLTGRTVLLPGEDMNQYLAFSKELVDSLNPQTPLERQLAQTYADQQWRLNRLLTIEDALLAYGHETSCHVDTDNPDVHTAYNEARNFRDSSQTFLNLSIYEQRIRRAQNEALRELRALQAERQAAEKAQLDEAVRLHKTQEMLGLPADPAPGAFVYARALSAEDVTRESLRRDRLEAAEIARKTGYNLAAFREITQKVAVQAAA